ncbi:MAG: CRISPR-associated helicase Cas3' [Smithella sp.]|nr:CRISPR-associated helicase Cas3' [Smithella sp.]
MTYYAHKVSIDSKKIEFQTLFDHLTNTARIANDLGQASRLSDFAIYVAAMHDIGKYSSAFQKRLSGSTQKVDHSTAGAIELVEKFQNDENRRFIATLLAYCIAGHHSGLPDYGSVIDTDSECTLQGRLHRKVEDYQAYLSEIDSSKLNLPSKLPIKLSKTFPSFSIAFLTRMIYSILVDADFLDTETFMNQGEKPRGNYPAINELDKTLSQYLQKFGTPSNRINQRRAEILSQCISKANTTPGFFSLTVPTGGGKTFSSLAFALKHAVAFGMDRIIYIIPYTSIIEQNANQFKLVFGEDNVLEHHSNFDWEGRRKLAGQDDTDDDTLTSVDRLRLAAENWDIPIIVSTNVQFFESLFANRSSQCRKIHNLAKSVLIFDEAQMLPRDFLMPCIQSILELVRNYGSSAVFCTATQPSLQRFLPRNVEVRELMDDPQTLYRDFKRVRVRKVGKLTDNDLAIRLNSQNQTLCVVNTRKHAKVIYDLLQEDGRFHLSTLMCPIHRQMTIKAIRECLKSNLPCRVVSTQLIEAGIDIDFPVGYRAMAGLDSIIQAAGRINREGQITSGELIVFEPDSDCVKRVPAFIQQGADVTRSVLEKYSDDPVCIEAIHAYYNELFSLQDPNAFDTAGILRLFEKGLAEPNFDFKTAAEKFKIIDNCSHPIIIPFDENAKGLIDTLRFSPYPRSILRKLQIYTVNVFESEFDAISTAGHIDTINDSIAVLNWPEGYDEKTGLILPGRMVGEGIFL